MPGLLIIAVLFYFLMIRPERRKQATHRSLLEALKKNDRVVTVGGIYGVVTNVQRETDEVTIKVDESTNTKLRVTFGSIARVITDAVAGDKTSLTHPTRNHLPWLSLRFFPGSCAQVREAARPRRRGGRRRRWSTACGSWWRSASSSARSWSGGLIARALRVPEYSFRIGLDPVALVAGVAVCIAGWPPKRGIDLSGGVVLVYEVDSSRPSPRGCPTAIVVFEQRVEPAGGAAVEARPAGAGQIEIVAPDGFDPAAGRESRACGCAARRT